jgi:arylsulfatase A-like enzyme
VALLLLALLAARPDAMAAQEPARPNIVFILADDLGYGDAGCYNPGSKIPTPNLDRLAAQGMRFTDAHAPASVCTPTRYALLTGRYAWRSSLKRGVLAPWEEPLIAAGRLTVPALLKRHGYTTGMIGKWHLGWDWPTKGGSPVSSGSNRLSNVDFTRPIANGPTARGFDFYFGVDVPNYPPYCFIENDRTAGVPSVPDAGRDELFIHPGPMQPGWRMVDILPELTRRAVQWVEDAAKSGQPFFLYLPLTSPHYPVVPAPEFKGKSRAGDYGDFVFQTDWTVGRVLDALGKAGVATNTLVIFTSDNGPESAGGVKPGAYDRVRQFQHHSMGELRGVKRDLWEGGHRVPFLVRWPARIKSGTVSAATICHVDFMATVAALLDVKLPANAGEDSFSFLPVLLGTNGGRPVREALVHHAASGAFAIRKGDWVLIEAPTGDDKRGQGEPPWFRQERGHVPDNQPGQLFNVREDLAERTNQYAGQPRLVREMKQLLAKYQNDGRSTPGEVQANDKPRVPRNAANPRRQTNQAAQEK